MLTEPPVWPNELMIRDTGIVPDDGGGRIYTTVGFGYTKEKYVRSVIVERHREQLAILDGKIAEIVAENTALQSKLDESRGLVRDLTTALENRNRELKEQAGRLEEYRKLADELIGYDEKQEWHGRRLTVTTPNVNGIRTVIARLEEMRDSETLVEKPLPICGKVNGNNEGPGWLACRQPRGHAGKCDTF